MATNRIPQDFIQDLLSRTDIVPLIQARVTIKKSGHNYLGCCPFHQEKTASFSINQEKQFYYCFGCGASGNAIKFLMTFDRMEFTDAVHYLAAQSGLEVPVASHQSIPDYAELYQTLNKVTGYYQAQLDKNSSALAYLQSRRITSQTIKDFVVGYAPNDWQSLSKQAKLQDHLLKTGMIIQKQDGHYYDRFRHRIIFPIRDIKGRTIAFGGRSLDGTLPKYLNSPETVLFHKSNELYGLYEAKLKNRALAELLIVEGYMDVITLFQFGITNAVATLGTAINLKHLQKLLRYTSHIIFCFDGDEAGKRAAWKALIISLPILRDGINIRFLFLPENEDPDSLLNKIGAEKFQNLIKQAAPLTEVFFNELQKQFPLNSLANSARFAKEASQYLNTMPQSIFQQLLFKQLAELLGVEMAAIDQLIQQANLPEVAPQNPIYQAQLSNSKLLPTAYLACAILLQQPELMKFIPDLTLLRETQEITGLPLFIEVVNLIEQHPNCTIGNLLIYCKEDTQTLLAKLAIYQFSIPKDGFKDEFIGALNCLYQQASRNFCNQLIKKAKSSGLNDSERQELQILLNRLASKENFLETL